MSDQRVGRFLYACFFLSGAAGLIYEVVWARQLALFLGITTYANTAVITAYMIGLAAGSLALGRVADRRQDHLRLYALLEVGIGVYAATTPLLVAGLQGLYAGTAGALGMTGAPAHLLRFSLALLALIVPTFMMGGTLPLLVRGLTRSLPDLARNTGRLYGVNTLGATAGTFAAGYLLLPAVGVVATLFVAVALNLGVAAAVLLVARRLSLAHAPAKESPQPAKGKQPAPGSQPPRQKQPAARRAAPAPVVDVLSPTTARLLLIGFAISGFAALVYQIAWIRALTLVIGSSVYAFSTTLTTYLAGLALGSLLYARFLAGADVKAGRRMNQAAAMEIAISLSAVLGLALIGLLPNLFLSGYRAGLQANFALFQAFIFGLSFLVMVVPTLLLGALFPLITALWTRDARAVGRGVGTAYAANTAGTILGSLLGGLLLLPTLGIQNSIFLASGLHLAVGVGFWLLSPERLRAAARYGAVAAVGASFALLVWLVPSWDKELMTSGVYMYADRTLALEAEGTPYDRRLLYYAEGIDGVVSVAESDQRILVINGKTDASNRGDLPTQVLLAQLPLLIHPDPTRALVIGLGSGITVGSAATHASLDQIDVLEISPEVVEASGFFAEENGNVLADPRVNLVVADARNFALAGDQAYDVIISEPSNPWISGISNLFTQEFFELARSRLAPDGVMSQWFHLYGMSAGDLKTVLETFQSVFPHVTVWMPLPGDVILLGSTQPHALDYERLAAALDRPEIAADLARIDIVATPELMSTYVMGGDVLASYSAGAPLNTDNRPRIEFNAPRNLYADTTYANVLELSQHASGSEENMPVTNLAQATPDGLAVPGMGLEVKTSGPLGDDQWDMVWQIDRRVFPAEPGGPPQVGVANQRTLSWHEASGATEVVALYDLAEPTAEDQKSLLEQVFSGGTLQGGDVDLPGGREGRWVIGPGEKPGQIKIGINWLCPVAQGGFTEYMALHEQDDPGEDGWGPALLDLAGRFRCTG